MAPKLKPLMLPQLVEERRRKEEATQFETLDCDAVNRVYTTDSSSSDATSPVTPTFSTRGHLRYSSSMSSFELTTPAGSDELPASPKQATHTSSKRTLENVEEEPFEYDHFEDYDVDFDDEFSDRYIYDCLCDEPCLHRDADMTQSTSNLYAQSSELGYDFGCLSDSDFHSAHRPRKPSNPDSPYAGFSQRFGSRFATLRRWKPARKSINVNSPVSDFGVFDARPAVSRAASRAPSSRSSSLSASGRYLPDRTNEPPLPPTPALSYYGSSDSVTLPGPLDVERANDVLFSIERERAQATTPLLPPLMTASSTDQTTAQPSPLESPTIVSPLSDEPHSPLVLSPPLSTKPSISSFRQMPCSGELPPMPPPDAWSDILGHANFTIVPQPYKPEAASLNSLRDLRSDWEAARVNYTKHLVRTGEHYGITSKTYKFTEEKWAETERNWRAFHDEVADALVASGEAIIHDKFDEAVPTTVPRMDAEGKFPERGDVDIVGPMVREAAMSPTGMADRKRPGFWRNLTDRVGLKK
ncbi:hypothetical protein F4780DRAFT_424136 [Xylariomycetidae sp. FL0641]|nr:hypothetical protein F4780DRAFT_424136 [Xylariomycetidae sp. FL0641]